MELSDGYRRASVHGDRTRDDGRDSPEPSSDADGLCILKSPRISAHQVHTHRINPDRPNPRRQN